MHAHKAAAGIFLCLLVTNVRANARQAPASPQNGEVVAIGKDSAAVAEINGRKVTLRELEQKEAGRLLQARSQYYEAERQALDRLIDDTLLALEAERRKISVDQMLAAEVNSKVQDPAEEQLEGYYESMQTDEPFAAVRQQILLTMRQLRANKLRSVFLQSLRSKASIRIFLRPPSVEVALGGAPTRGSRQAPVMIVEFADYECPFCQQMHPLLQRLQDELGGRVAFTFKDFPLSMHPHAEKAAEAARCAGEQGKFWDYNDLLFRNPGNLEMTQLREDARALNLDATRFDKCLDTNEQASRVGADVSQGQLLGVSATPSFFINGHFLSGAVGYDALRAIVEQELQASAPPPK
jgi:predicted DsbA family dithiol-disulfide isomerase